MDLTQNQEQIYQICSHLSADIPKLLDHLNIDYNCSNDMFFFPCPVHGGDNQNGCSIMSNGVWSCWTHSCHEEYKKNIFGFVRGVLSSRNSKVSMSETMDYCLSFLNKDIKSLKVEAASKSYELKRQEKLLDIFNKKVVRENIKTIPREAIRRSLDIPSKYFSQERKFDKSTLNEFDVGDCHKYGKEMFKRAVVPVYDENWVYVGCTGRTLNDAPNKWKNSKGLDKSTYLYGLNIAKEYIIKTRTAILVEGPPDVWACHSCGYKNSVAIFGCDLSDYQLILLETIGCDNIVILTDNDEAGNKAAEKILKKCGRRFNYFRPEYLEKDPGSYSEKIQELGKILGDINVR